MPRLNKTGDIVNPLFVLVEIDFLPAQSLAAKIKNKAHEVLIYPIVDITGIEFHPIGEVLLLALSP
ncbi:MAG: hypothetical protein OEZ39_10825 [Gammaproteobacteria bacterium]|nr:hypothetical protein [Gammaproteobacteria bacterium]MDH5652337.1 hypothetical protein [Gammaproteobacteria bacterium]